MDHFTLAKYDIRDASDHQILVLLTGDRLYKTILSRAFPAHFMSRTFDDRYGRYEWGTYIHNVDTEGRGQIERMLQLFQQHVYIQDDLTETFALDYHTEMASFGGYAGTEIGQLVYRAKPYKRSVEASHYQNTAELAKRMIAFIEQHPGYSQAEVVIPVPPSRLDKPFDLPTELVRQIATACNMEDGSAYVQKVRSTRPMKDCKTPQEKINNVRNAYGLNAQANVRNRRILLIDDIYQTGFTINEVARLLFDAGTHSVFGLVATKTARDL